MSEILTCLRRENDSASAENDSAAGRDPEIEAPEEAKSSAASLFDIRRIIGGLFTLYGVLVLGAGLSTGRRQKKAAGIDINLWTGLAMLVFGLRCCCGGRSADRAGQSSTTPTAGAPRADWAPRRRTGPGPGAGTVVNPFTRLCLRWAS